MKKLMMFGALVAILAVGAGVAFAGSGCDKAAKLAKAGKFESTADTDVFYGLTDANPQVTQLDNGVKILVATNNAELVQKIEKRMGSCPISSGCANCPLKGKSVKRTMEKTDEGLVIMATSDNAEEVAALHEYGASLSAKSKSAKNS